MNPSRVSMNITLVTFVCNELVLKSSILLDYEHPIGVVFNQEPLNDLQKHQVVKIIEETVNKAVDKFITDNIENLDENEIQTDDMKKKILLTMTRSHIKDRMPRLTNMARNFFEKNHDDILEEMENKEDGDNVRMFKFSEVFKQQVDEAIAKMEKAKENRDLGNFLFLSKMAFMQKTSSQSAKDSITSYLQDSNPKVC